MSAVPLAVRLGMVRGWLEFRQTLANRTDLSYLVVFNTIYFAVLFLERHTLVDGVSLATLTLPGLLGMTVVSGGVMGTATVLATDREDGTLLRAKAIPQGMVGYLVARITSASLSTVLGVLIILVPGMFTLDAVQSAGPAGLLTLTGVLALGLLATLPWGALVGALAKTPGTSFGITFLALGGIIAISGIFYPISALPGWVQGLAQFFPAYWLGLGMRSALLPGTAVANELGDSWRHLEMIGVLGAWAVVGVLVAPTVLRRMARHESGSAMETRKQQALQRVT